MIHVDCASTGRARSPTCPRPRGCSDIAFLGGTAPVYHILTNAAESVPTSRPTPMCSVIITFSSATPRISAACSAAGIRTRTATTSRPGTPRGWRRRLRRQARRRARSSARAPTARRRQAQTWRPARDRSDARGSALRLSDPQAALQPIHAGVRAERLGDLEEGLLPARRRSRPPSPRVSAEVPLEDLKDAARILERRDRSRAGRHV